MDVERIYDENHIEAVPLLFEVSQAEPGRYRVHMGFRTDRFSSEWAESFMETYLQILRELFAKETLRELILVSNEQAEQLDAFNRTEKTVEDTDIVTLFRRAAAQHPEKTAVICGDRRLTYRELDHLSDRIAACARNLGIGPEDVVSILISRSEMMVVTALGALKAGAAYQPLDPSYPPERLQYMVKVAGACAADEGHRDAAGGRCAGYRADAGQPADPALHVRHHRPAEGRHAHAPGTGELLRLVPDVLRPDTGIHGGRLCQFRV